MTGESRVASDELEKFINDAVEEARAKGYRAPRFDEMRSRCGTIETISRLVRSGDIHSGFIRMCELGLKEKTVEAAVLKFRDEFTENDRQCAQWRLDQVKS